MKKFLATLLFFVSHFAVCAPFKSFESAESSEASINSVIENTPMPCMKEASELMNKQFLQVTADGILESMGESLDSQAEWNKGHSKYDRAHAIVIEALAEEERVGGSIFRLTPDGILNFVTSKWSLDEKSYYMDFFSTKSGKLFLTDMLDGATCRGWLTGLNLPPFPPLESMEKSHWDVVMDGFKGSEERFLAKFQELSPEEQKSFNEGNKRLTHVFDSALMLAAQERTKAIEARVVKAVQSHMGELSEIINSP